MSMLESMRVLVLVLEGVGRKRLSLLLKEKDLTEKGSVKEKGLGEGSKIGRKMRMSKLSVALS